MGFIENFEIDFTNHVENEDIYITQQEDDAIKKLDSQRWGY